jgi:hypothetical protein
VVCESAARYGTRPGVVGDERGFLVDMSRCDFNPPLRLAGGESYVIRSEYGADANNFAPVAFPPPYEGVMGYMYMAFTVPEGTDLGVFSASGNRTMASALGGGITVSEAAAKAAAKAAASGGGDDGENATAPANTGLCVVPPAPPDVKSDDRVTPLTIASAAAATTATDRVATITPATPVALEPNGGGGFVQLTPEHNFTMQWAFVDGGESVAFKLRLEMPTWMSIGIHRPGRVVTPSLPGVRLVTWNIPAVIN